MIPRCHKCGTELVYDMWFDEWYCPKCDDSTMNKVCKMALERDLGDA